MARKARNRKDVGRRDGRKKGRVRPYAPGRPSRGEYEPVGERFGRSFRGPFKTRGRKRPVGWRGEPERHDLARQGVKTTPPHFGQVFRAGGLVRNLYGVDATITRLFDIAGEVGLSEHSQEVFANYYLTRGFSPRDEGYMREWAERFARGEEWNRSDLEGRRVLQKINQVGYPKDINEVMR